MESKIVLQQLVSAIKQSTNHPELWDSKLRRFIGYAEKALNNPDSTNDEYEYLIEELYNEVPPQTDDQDWWPDELGKAMKNAKSIVE